MQAGLTARKVAQSGSGPIQLGATVCDFARRAEFGTQTDRIRSGYGSDASR
jgi:hypothetical protein